MLFVAGQTALDTDGRIAHVGDLWVSSGMRWPTSARWWVAGRHAAGPGEGDVLRGRQARVLARAAEIGRVYREMMEGHWPATTLVEVRALWDDEALVEIDAIAVLG